MARLLPAIKWLLKSVMIAQWNSRDKWEKRISLSVLPVARVQFPATADHTLPTRPEPAWQKMAQSPLNDTTQPVGSEEEGQCPTMNRLWLKEKKIYSISVCACNVKWLAQWASHLLAQWMRIVLTLICTINTAVVRAENVLCVLCWLRDWAHTNCELLFSKFGIWKCRWTQTSTNREQQGKTLKEDNSDALDPASQTFASESFPLHLSVCFWSESCE